MPTLGSLGGYFWNLRAALGAFDVILEALAEYGGDFGVTLGLILGRVWGQFRYLWVTSGHLMVTLQ